MGIESELKQRKAWNPAKLGLLTFIISFIATGIFFIINWGRLGYPNLRKREIVNLVFIAAANLILLTSVGIAAAALIIFFLNTGYSLYIHVSQRRAYKQHISKGGRQASVTLLLIPGTLIDLAIVAIVYGAILLSVTEQEQQLMDAERTFRDRKYEQAISAYNEILATDSLCTDCYAGIALCYGELGQNQRAAEMLNKALSIQPSYTKAARVAGELRFNNRRESPRHGDTHDNPCNDSSIICGTMILSDSVTVSTSSDIFSINPGGPNLFIRTVDGELIVFDTLGRTITDLDLNLRTPELPEPPDTATNELIFYEISGPFDRVMASTAGDYFVEYRDNVYVVYAGNTMYELFQSLKAKLRYLLGFGSEITLYRTGQNRELFNAEIDGSCNSIDVQGDYLAVYYWSYQVPRASVYNFKAGERLGDWRLSDLSEVVLSGNRLYAVGGGLAYQYLITNRGIILERAHFYYGSDNLFTKRYTIDDHSFIGVFAAEEADTIGSAMLFNANGPIDILKATDSNSFNPLWWNNYTIFGTAELVSRSNHAIALSDYYTGSIVMFDLDKEPGIGSAFFLSSDRIAIRTDDTSIVFANWRFD